MTIEYLKDLINEGHEIEFEYKGNDYSITYSPMYVDDDFISFCEYYQEPIDVKTFEELLNVEYKGKTVREIWESLTEEDAFVL